MDVDFGAALGAHETVAGAEPTDEPRAEPDVRLRRGAKGLFTTSGRVLLVEERHGDGSSFWTLPGGGVRAGESLVEGLRRELAEELGCVADVGEVAARFWYAHTSIRNTLTRYTVFSAALATGARPNPREGVVDHRWVPRTALPPSTLPQVRFVVADRPDSG